MTENKMINDRYLQLASSLLDNLNFVMEDYCINQEDCNKCLFHRYRVDEEEKHFICEKEELYWYFEKYYSELHPEEFEDLWDLKNLWK